MNHSYRNYFLAICAIFCLGSFTACNKYSPDTPFPDVYTSTIFTASNNKIVYALDPKTGATKWKFSVSAEVHATPVVFANALWVATTDGNLYKINKLTGELIDSKNLGGPIEGTPMPNGDVLLVPAGNLLYSVNSDLSTNWGYDIGSAIVASPTIHDIAGGAVNTIFVAGVGNTVSALNHLGSPFWTYTPATAGSFYSSPCVVNDSFLYIGNDNGNIYALYTSDGTQKWAYTTQGQVRSSPISIGGNVLFGSNDRNFYSVDTATGLLRWKLQTQDIITSSPSVYNQNVYFGGYDNMIYCIDIIDGTIKWKKPTFGLIKSSPVIANGSVYISSFDKNLYKLDAKDGSQQWVKDIYGQMECSAIVDGIDTISVPSINGNYKY